MTEKIRIYLSDWQYNAGVVGLYNILDHAGDEVRIGDQYIEIDIEMLENFEEKYFNYFIETYEKVTDYHKIMNKLNILINLDDEQRLKIYEKNLNDINKILKRPPYEEIRKRIFDNQSNFKNVNKAILEKIKKELEKERNKILKKECIGHYNQRKRTSREPNAIIDKYINTNMLHIKKTCNEVKEYLEKDKSNFELDCFICGNKINNFGKGLSFLLNTFFDTNRKLSHIWNFSIDIEICPICKFVYYCVPAGFVTVYGKGLFINSNRSLQDLIKTNTTARMEALGILRSENEFSTYKILMNAINKQSRQNLHHELQDVQVIRYDDGKYRFNILSKDVLKVIRESEEEISSLMNIYYKIKQKTKWEYFNVYDNLMANILNNYNMFTLIHKLLIFKIAESDMIVTNYHMGHVMNLNIININYLKGVENMDKVKENRELVSKARKYGYYLRQKYLDRDPEADKNRIRGISYRLLNALKTRNSEMFMHNIITSYMYIGEIIPKNITLALENEEMLGIIGYAFVTGLNGGDYKDENNDNGGENDEN